MRIFSLLHRWLGGLVGVLLAVLGLTGALLTWRPLFTFVSQPARSAPLGLDRIAQELQRAGRPVERVTFASDEFGFHQVAYVDGGGAYLNRGGTIVASWDHVWQRPELALFDLHHHLALGEFGETLTGVAGLIGLFFAISGVWLWWRMRSRYRLRLWPAKLTPGAIVHHHRDLGVVSAPLLIVSALTGVMMVFPAATKFVLAPLGKTAAPAAVTLPPDHRLTANADFRRLLAEAARRFPGAAPRRLQWPAKPGQPVSLRLRQSFEWTPNGRTFVKADPATMAIVGVEDPARGGAAGSITEKLYPIHSGKAGGLLWRLLLTASGLALTMLGTLAVYGFWKTRANIRSAARKRRRKARGQIPQ